MLAVLNADPKTRNAAQAAIQAFPENLPFEFEEQKNDQASVAGLNVPRLVRNVASCYPGTGALTTVPASPG